MKLLPEDYLWNQSNEMIFITRRTRYEAHTEKKALG